MSTITPEDYGTLEEIAYEHDLTARDDYSGRGMYGKSCIGVTGDDIGNVIRMLFELKDNDEDLAYVLVDGRIATDSMGLSTIFYWPGVSVEDDGDEDEEVTTP